MDVTPAANASSGSSSVPSSSKTVHDVIAKVDVAEFDWKAYEGTYRGRALITRLNHIPTILLSNSNSTPAHSLHLARTALQRLLPLIKETWDTSLYLRVATALEDTRVGAKGGPVRRDEDEAMDGTSASRGASARGEIDMDWVESARDAERKEGSRLDVELRGYMSNLIKESIRLTYLAFAQLSLKSGRASDALKNYTSAREYSTSPAHHVDLYVGILDTSLAFNNPGTLPGYVTKLEGVLDRAYPAPAAAGPRIGAEAAAAATANLTAADVRENQEKEARSAEMRRNVGVKIRVAKGLDALARKEWERAGREMGEVGEEGGLAGWEGKAISTADIALITALCTLATSRRDRIRRVLLERTSFRSAVDDSQGWIIELVRAFMEAKYGEVSVILNKAEPQLVLNPFLYQHTVDLISLIQTRAIVQYVAPFSSIKIDTMARAFDRNTDDMLREVEYLVGEGRIKGRVDLIDGVLEMKQDNARGELFKEAFRVAKSTTMSSKAALLRMRLHEAGITVDPRPPGDMQTGQRLGMGQTDSMDLESMGGEDFGMMGDELYTR